MAHEPLSAVGCQRQADDVGDDKEAPHDPAGHVQGVRLLAMRLGKPPAGYGHWTLQLLADELVALEVVDSISHETVRKTLKKMA